MARDVSLVERNENRGVPWIIVGEDFRPPVVVFGGLTLHVRVFFSLCCNSTFLVWKIMIW